MRDDGHLIDRAGRLESCLGRPRPGSVRTRRNHDSARLPSPSLSAAAHRLARRAAHRVKQLVSRRPEPVLHPVVSSATFLSRLLADFADEWLWRPAMHCRWSFPRNAKLIAELLSERVAERRVRA